VGKAEGEDLHEPSDDPTPDRKEPPQSVTVFSKTWPILHYEVLAERGTSVVYLIRALNPFSDLNGEVCSLDSFSNETH
jgi:hypothetical protein